MTGCGSSLPQAAGRVPPFFVVRLNRNCLRTESKQSLRRWQLLYRRKARKAAPLLGCAGEMAAEQLCYTADLVKESAAASKRGTASTQLIKRQSASFNDVHRKSYCRMHPSAAMFRNCHTRERTIF